MLTVAGFALAASMVVGQADGDVTFKSLSEHIVGGTWTTTIDEVTLEHSYRWALNNKFLQVTLKGGFNAGTSLVGIDPQTKACTGWGFGEDGGVGKWMFTQEAAGVWSIEGRILGPNGEIVYKGKLTRVDQNTAREEISALVIKGVKQSPRTNTWIRK